MNYLYQMPYLVSNRPLDYSEASSTSTTITNTLNENSLSESSGIGENVASGWQAVVGGVDANNNYQSSLASFTGSVDFNHDNIIAPAGSTESKNIHVYNIPGCDISTNGPATSYATLNSYDDWDNLNLEFRQSQLFQNGFFTINAADPSGSEVANINSQAISSLADTIDSLPNSAFAGNIAKQQLDDELVTVSNTIQAGKLVGPGSASDQLQNIVLPQMTGTSSGSNVVLITDPASQAQISAIVTNIINALVAEGTPSSTDPLAPGAQDEVLTTNENTPLGVTLHAAASYVSNPPLAFTITNPSHGTLSSP
ncbi:MAG: hypothetical protein KGL95_00475, partial [Patescibacteria group bacterium]|nr:hypothetical protein [Patescibacteria group bacterium]